jgi:hypothetical protein
MKKGECDGCGSDGVELRHVKANNHMDEDVDMCHLCYITIMGMKAQYAEKHGRIDISNVELADIVIICTNEILKKLDQAKQKA